MPSKKEQRLVTLPLNTLVDDLLQGFDYRTISKEIAEILSLVQDGQAQYHIQFPGENEVDISGNPIEEPRLWSLTHWRTNSERWQRARLRTEKERALYLVKEANIALLTKPLVKMFCVNPEAAKVIARIMLDKNQEDKIRYFLGDRKLYTNIKEIP